LPTLSFQGGSAVNITTATPKCKAGFTLSAFHRIFKRYLYRLQSFKTLEIFDQRLNSSGAKCARGIPEGVKVKACRFSARQAFFSFYFFSSLMPAMFLASFFFCSRLPDGRS